MVVRMRSLMLLLLFNCVLVQGQSFAQEKRGNFDEWETKRNPDVSAPVYPRYIDVNLSELPKPKTWKPGDPIKVVPRKGGIPEFTPEEKFEGMDPLIIHQKRVASGTDLGDPILNYEGQTYNGVDPPDTVGDVGMNYFIQAINAEAGTTYVIYNKADGSVAAGPFNLAGLGSGTCADGLGDPIVLYDQMADRWLLSEFSNSANVLCVYVSQTNDPINGGWYNYSFNTPFFPDYPKYGVWSDAYYVGSNEDEGPGLYAMDRRAMLNGAPATMQRFSVDGLPGFGFQMLIPADHDGARAPVEGRPGIFMRHRDGESHGVVDVSHDDLQLWELSVDFENPTNSRLDGPLNVEIAEIDSDLCGLFSFECFRQPSGPDLDPLREVIMFRLAYRNFGTYEALIGNFVTDVDGNDHGGLRWFELRRSPEGDWRLFQEGTYAPDSNNRWMGGIAMDGAGNIAMAYNVGSDRKHPSLAYVGRKSDDPPGVMSQSEVEFASGAGSNLANRYGDYSAMSIDPADDCTFWFTGMYNPTESWSTRIASFSFANCGQSCTPPAVPDGLTLVPAMESISLSWNPVDGAQEYAVYRGLGNCGDNALVQVATTSETQWQDTQVQEGTTYHYSLRAIGDCESQQSSCMAATTQTVPLSWALWLQTGYPIYDSNNDSRINILDFIFAGLGSDKRFYLQE